MLYAIAAILLGIWIIGLVVKATFAAIHLLLLLAVAAVVWGYLRSRMRRGTAG